MKIISETRTIELTRRNLLALIAKLDGHPPGSSRIIASRDSEGRSWWVKAVEDDEHYSDARPGPCTG